MTNYHLKPPSIPPQQTAWQVAKEQRKKVLDGVRARRREIYKKFLAKRKAAPSYS